MADSRVAKLAEILTSYSIKINKGDIIEVNCGPEAKPLALELMKIILKKGAYPHVQVGLPGSSYAYYKNASEEQLKHLPEIGIFVAKKAAGSISIGTEINTRELTSIEPSKISLRRKITKPISDIYMKKDNWVLLQYPTNALAQDAEMSLEEFEDFVYDACIVDYKKMDRQQTKLQQVLNKGDKVHIIGDDTDLRFSIKGRKAIKCCGNRNIPDGEVFTAPIENSAEGYISYTYPAIMMGREVSGIKLWFKKGKVVKAMAEKNEAFLQKMIDTDKGARYIGEFGIGVNYNLKKHIKQILFDEKLGGTIHLALGMSYKESGGKNQSAIHWDMIKDLKKGGKIILDGRTIQENGRFRL